MTLPLDETREEADDQRMDELPTGSSWRYRRGQLKASILGEVCEYLWSEPSQVIMDEAEEWGLSDETVKKVYKEIAEEIERRIFRLPDPLSVEGI